MMTIKNFKTGILAASLTCVATIPISMNVLADPCATPEAQRVLEQRQSGARQMEQVLDRELRKTVGSGDVTDSAGQMMLSCSDEVNSLIDNISGGGTFSSILRAFNLGSTVCNELNKIDDKYRGLTGYGIRETAGTSLPPKTHSSSSGDGFGTPGINSSSTANDAVFNKVTEPLLRPNTDPGVFRGRASNWGGPSQPASEESRGSLNAIY